MSWISALWNNFECLQCAVVTKTALTLPISTERAQCLLFHATWLIEQLIHKQPNKHWGTWTGGTERCVLERKFSSLYQTIFPPGTVRMLRNIWLEKRIPCLFLLYLVSWYVFDASLSKDIVLTERDCSQMLNCNAIRCFPPKINRQWMKNISNKTHANTDVNTHTHMDPICSTFWLCGIIKGQCYYHWVFV